LLHLRASIILPPGWVRSIAVSMSVCLSVHLLMYVKNHMSRLFVLLLVAMAQSFSDNSATRYVLQVLWTMSFFA